MKRIVLALVAAFTLASLTMSAAGAQPSVPGPREPGGPGSPRGPRPPRGPQPPRGPGNRGGSEIAIYDGVSRQNRVATITRRGSEYRVYSGNRGSPVMTKKGSRIYDGQRITISAVIFTVRANRIIPGTSNNIANATCTIVGSRFFDGTTTSLQNLQYTLKGKRLYKGSSRRISDVKYTISGSVNNDVKAILAVLSDC